MDFMVNIDIKKLPHPITYQDRLLLVGSCFTEHIGNTLGGLKFSLLQNPNGILFDTRSVCASLVSYVEGKQYNEDDLFYLNEVWNSWEHHSRFSHISKEECLRGINNSQMQAHEYLKNADWVIITLGSSFSYILTEEAKQNSLSAVANCHRAPAAWFRKHMMEISETISLLDNCYHRLKRFNPKLKIIFTVSPVRHLRDGVVDNNRSKARLLESVHHLVNKFDDIYYFPSYELVIDVLRDYRFYDIDMAHPNYMATEFVLEKFAENCIDINSQQLMQEIKKLMIAKRHKAFQPETKAHKQFLEAHAEKAATLQKTYPFLNLKEELEYFTK